MNIQQSLEVETNLSLHNNKSDTGAINSLKAMKKAHIDLMLLQDGDTILIPQRIRLNLRRHDGNQAATCGQRGTGTRGNLHLGVSSVFLSSQNECFLTLAENLISWQSTGEHLPRTRFLMLILSACLSSLLPQLFRFQPHCHVLTPRTRVAQGAHCLCLAQKRHTSSRNVIRYTSLEHSFLLFDTIFLTSTFQPPSTLCRSTTSSEWRFSELPSITGYEPLQLAEHKDHRHSTEDNQLVEYQDLAEHDDSRVTPQFFHRPSIASTYDSAESIVTPPPDSGLDDEQIRALLASPLYLQEREASADRSQLYHSARENLMSSSSQDPIRTVRPVALFSSKSKKRLPIEKIFFETSTGFWGAVNFSSDSLIR